MQLNNSEQSFYIITSIFSIPFKFAGLEHKTLRFHQDESDMAHEC